MCEREHALCEGRELSGASPDGIAGILLNCTMTWQKRGHSSLLDVVFVIAHVMGKVIDDHVKAKHYTACQC